MYSEVTQYPPFAVNKDGCVININTGNILKQQTSKRGYKTVCTSYDGKQRFALVHRLIAIAFIPNPENKPDVNHKDSNRSNNSIDNLEWVTSSENALHGYKEGSRIPTAGEKSSLSRFTESTIREACRMISEGFRNIDISNQLGISSALVSDIKLGKRWKHVSKEYFDYSSLPPKSATLSVDKVNRVCRLLEEGKSPREISKLLGLKYHIVIRIKRRVTYVSISDKYAW